MTLFLIGNDFMKYVDGLYPGPPLRIYLLNVGSATINEHVSNIDLVTAILCGLGPDYGMIVTVIMNFLPLPAFQNLRARLLSHEIQIITPIIPLVTQTALMETQKLESLFELDSGSQRL